MFKCQQVPILYSCFQDGSSLYYVMEYCNGGTLKDYLDQCRRIERYLARLPIAEVKKITAELVVILEVMRSYGVCHRDFKLQNLVFDAEGHLKVIDFGSAKIYEKTQKNESRFDRIKSLLLEYENKALMKQSLEIVEDDNELDTSDTESKSLVGSAIYSAPEMLINGYSDFETDYWSLGRVRLRRHHRVLHVV